MYASKFGPVMEEMLTIRQRSGLQFVNGKLYLSHLGKKGNEYLSHPTKPL